MSSWPDHMQENPFVANLSAQEQASRDSLMMIAEPAVSEQTRSVSLGPRPLFDARCEELTKGLSLASLVEIEHKKLF